MMWEGGGVKTRSKMGVENDLMTTNGGLGKIGAATWTLVKRASEGQIHRWEISGIGPGPIFVFKRSIKRAGHDLRLIIVPDSGQKSVRNDYRYLGDDGSDQLQIIGND